MAGAKRYAVSPYCNSAGQWTSLDEQSTRRVSIDRRFRVVGGFRVGLREAIRTTLSRNIISSANVPACRPSVGSAIPDLWFLAFSSVHSGLWIEHEHEISFGAELHALNVMEAIRGCKGLQVDERRITVGFETLAERPLDVML